ncbi:MAG TPA: hypothetical protein VLE89_08685 [Chlamydiales bacterium]|nr:hypothetical protein [Chlamydiales bacterium]
MTFFLGVVPSFLRSAPPPAEDPVAAAAKESRSDFWVLLNPAGKESLVSDQLNVIGLLDRTSKPSPLVEVPLGSGEVVKVARVFDRDAGRYNDPSQFQINGDRQEPSSSSLAGKLNDLVDGNQEHLATLSNVASQRSLIDLRDAILSQCIVEQGFNPAIPPLAASVTNVATDKSGCVIVNCSLSGIITHRLTEDFSKEPVEQPVPFDASASFTLEKPDAIGSAQIQVDLGPVLN